MLITENQSKRSGGTISLEKGRVEEMYFTIRGMNPECWSVYRGEDVGHVIISEGHSNESLQNLSSYIALVHCLIRIEIIM